ncbi:hypothetical protein SJ951_14120, partial [Enterococcus faecium]
QLNLDKAYKNFFRDKSVGFPRPGGCNTSDRSLRDRSFVFSSVGLTHRKRLVELWLLFKIH